MSVYKPGDKVRINLSDPEKRGVRGCFHGCEGTIAAYDPNAAALKVLVAPKVQIERNWFDFGEVELIESQETLVRADLEALQAAVVGLTNKAGSTAEMISDLADIGRTLGAAKADREALEGRIQGAQVALDALRGACRAGDTAEVWRAFDALERALRGVPATIEPSGEKLVICAECPTPRPCAAEVEAKLAEQGDLIKRLAERVTALEGGAAVGDRDAKR